MPQGSFPLLLALPGLAPGLPFSISRPPPCATDCPNRGQPGVPRACSEARPPLRSPRGSGQTALVPHPLPLPLPSPLSPGRQAASRPLRLFGLKLSWKKRERGRQERGRDKRGRNLGAGSRMVGPEGVPRKARGTRRTCSSSSSRSADRLRHGGPMAGRARVGSGRVGSGRSSANTQVLCGSRRQ